MASRGSGLLKLSLPVSKNPGLASRTSAAQFSSILSRCLSTSSFRPSPPIPPFRLDRLYPSARTSVWSLTQKRLATGSSSHNLLAHMEHTADNNPGSATAQNALYAALLRANMPAIVVERYQTGRFATNAACQATYLKALQRLGGGGMDNTGALAGYGNSQSSPHSSNMSGDTLQGIAQAIAAKSNGGNAAMSTRFSGAAGEQGTKRAPIYVVTDESWGQVIFKWVKMLLMFGLVLYVILVAIHLLIDTTGVLKRATGVGNIEASTQKARFSDVQGCDEAKEELQELVEFLKEPERFAKLGGKLPKGVLLTGPPGTGKTLLARAVAGEAGVPFFYMSGSEFDEIYVGVGAKRIRELFAQARSKSPAIIFIDELDAVGGKRSEKEASYHKQTLNQLLTELDGFEGDTGVIIIGATNFPNALDKALTRPGRFDRNVVVPLPDVRGRMKILEFYFKKITVADGIDSSVIARSTMGFSGADLENLVNQAAVRASKNKQSSVTIQDLDWAMDKIMMGAERRSAVIQDKDKLSTAYHEAGHTLVGMFTPGARDVYKATIMPRGQALGVTHFLPELDEVSVSRRQYRARIDVAMGGKAAEEIIYGEDGVTSGASSDIESATSLAHAMVSQFGMSDKVGDVNLAYDNVSTESRHVIEQEIRGIIRDARIRATKLLQERRKELELLARGLVKYEVLTLDEIKKVIAGENLPDKVASDPTGNIKLPELAVPPALPGNAPLPTPGAHTPLSGQTGNVERRADDKARGGHTED